MPAWYSDPPTLLAIVFVIAGFWCLLKGADFLVEGAVALAKRGGMHPAVIGATVVAFGTSLPELVVTLGSSIKAAAAGLPIDPDGPAAMALGNVVGSNIFNMGAILGLSALVRVLPVPRSTIRLDMPLMLLALTMLIVFSLPWGAEFGIIGRLEGAILFLGLIGFTVLAMRMGKLDADIAEELVQHRHSLGGSIGLILGGVAMLCLGGEVSLTGALAVSRDLGLSERVIGLTVMAIGTSLPELVTSIQAARRGQTEIAVANVVGSNIFNVLCIVGISAMVLPLPVPSGTLHWDYYWMMGINLILIPIFLRGRVVRRPEGALLVAVLITYVTLLLIQDAPAKREPTGDAPAAPASAPLDSGD